MSMYSKAAVLLLSAALVPGSVVAHPGHEHVARDAILPGTWYHEPDHPLHALFRRDISTDGATYPEVGTPSTSQPPYLPTLRPMLGSISPVDILTYFLSSYSLMRIITSLLQFKKTSMERQVSSVLPRRQRIAHSMDRRPQCRHCSREDSVLRPFDLNWRESYLCRWP